MPPPANNSPAFPWVSARLLWTIAGIAVAIAGSWFIPPLAPVALVASALVIALLLYDAVLGPRSADVTVMREELEHLALRKPARLSYRVINRSRWAVHVEIVDTPIEALEFPLESIRGLVGSHRQNVFSLPVTPRLRGPWKLGALYVSCRTAIGLVVRRWKIRAEADVQVFPDLSAVERYGELARRGRLVQAGFRRLRLRGQGGEFDSLREWTPDDEFRSINWKATARRGKLMVEQFDVERSQTVMLVLDAGRLMTPRLGQQRKFDYAITSALSVASIASLADDKVGLLAFANGIIEHLPPRSGAAHMSGMTRRIYDLQPRFEEADYSGAFTYLRRRQPKRSLVIFFTDMFDPVASAATLGNLALLVPRHLVMCVLMNDEAVQGALRTEPEGTHQAYVAGVAAELFQARQKAAAVLVQRGIMVLDVPAPSLTIALINAYVEIKARSML